jgi:hypothetical protein
MGAAPSVEDRSAAAFPVGVNEVGNRCFNARVFQRRNHQFALPGAIVGCFPMLHGAPAAHAKMPADRRDALRARFDDMKKAPPIGMA